MPRSGCVNSLRQLRNILRGLKPAIDAGSAARLETVPFQNGIYETSTRIILAALVFCLLALPFSARAADRVPSPAGDAANYPAVDIHSTEQVAIAADPYDSKDKTGIFRIDYLEYGFLPIRIIITNNSNHAISLADARIDFVDAAGDRIPTSEVDDVERRVDRIKRPDGGYKLPGPLSHIGSKPGKKSRAIQEDFQAFEYSFVEVDPHTTRSGFFFYDVKGLDHPLRGAKLLLTNLRNANGKDLFYFEIPFDKYLAAEAGPRADN